MKTSLAHLLGGFALLLAFARGAAAGEAFPAAEVFAPLVADPFETRTFASLLSLSSDRVDTTIASVGVGKNFGLYRWEGKRAGDASQIGLFVAFASQFDMDRESDPLINTDYRVGATYELRRGQFSGRARLFHQSSHLGDEIILQGVAPQRVDLSLEAVDLVLAWERSGFRPYAGGLYMLRSSPADVKEWGVQAGVDYLGTRPVLLGGRLVGGLNYRAFQTNDWHAGLSAKVGLEYGRPRPEPRGITVLFELYNGNAPFGEFFQTDVSYYGLALQFNY